MIVPVRHRNSRRTKVLMPAGLLAIAALGGLALIFPATLAQGATTTTTSTTTAVGTSVATTTTTLNVLPGTSRQPTIRSTSKSKSCGPLNLKGVSGVFNTGNPNRSS